MRITREHYFDASFCGSVGHSRGAQDVVLSKNEALSFHKRFIGDNNIDEECYGEESCDFEEVVEKFDHSEQTVSTPYYLNKNSALEHLLRTQIAHTRLINYQQYYKFISIIPLIFKICYLHGLVQFSIVELLYSYVLRAF